MGEDRPTYTVTSVVRRRQPKKPPSLRAPADVHKLMHERVKKFDREHFYAILSP